jgi:hypothetical protein
LPRARGGAGHQEKIKSVSTRPVTPVTLTTSVAVAPPAAQVQQRSIAINGHIRIARAEYPVAVCVEVSPRHRYIRHIDTITIDRGEVPNHVRTTVQPENKCIRVAIAPKDVVAVSSRQPIIASAAKQRIGPGAPQQPVVAKAAIQHVIA